MRSDYSTCPPFEDEDEAEVEDEDEDEEAGEDEPLDELFALERPPSDRTVRRDHLMLEEVRDACAEAYEENRETYEGDLIALLKPQGPLQCALVRHLAGALARYESFEALETALQRRFFGLSFGRPAQVILDVSAWQKYAQHSPRLRKSLQSGILKLIHEIERLQANAAGEKGHPVHVLDSNSG